MHELSIADGIVHVARRHADGRRVTQVEVKVGDLRQVVPSALRFAFELLTEGTNLDGAELVLHEIAAEGVCRRCGTHTTMHAFPLQCSACGDLDLEIVAGEELLVDAIELEQDVDSELELLMTEGSRNGG